MQTAYFAGGCFWCITPDFQETPGVESVVSGYSGGTEADPTYQRVKTQTTGHRETIAVDYDPAQITYEALLEIFLQGVDPFDGGGQFIDRGHSYTLAVYYTDDTQRRAAEARFAQLAQESGRMVEIAIEPFTAFYPAEEYHQDYYRKHPTEFQRELEESGRLNRKQHG